MIVAPNTSTTECCFKNTVARMIRAAIAYTPKHTPRCFFRFRLALIAVYNQVCLDQELQQLTLRLLIIMMVQNQFCDLSDIGGQIVCFTQKIMYKAWCFPLLIFLTGVTIAMFLAVLNRDVMENGGSLQDLLVFYWELLLFSQQLCQCIDFHDMLGTSGMAGFIAQYLGH